MNKNEVRTLAENGYFQRRPISGKIEETHISWIVLAKRFAFKIKKPVKLSFLDFSTVAKRKKFCEKEIQLNTRFSNIYLDVAPIRKYSGHWYIGRGKGKTKDYAICMKRLKSARRMDTMLEQKKVKKELIITLAKTISSFHLAADIVCSPFDESTARALFNDIRDVRNYIKEYLGKSYAILIDQAIHWSNQFLHTYAPRFQDRISAGFKRDLHGDLHTGNIFLYKKPLIFDCIEFNDSYRQIDVINEVAFFCMDLEFHGQGAFSKLFLREYQRCFPSFQIKLDNSLFTYYKCFRANIRSKVKIINAQQVRHNQVVFREHLRSAKTYLDLIRSYMKLEGGNH